MKKVLAAVILLTVTHSQLRGQDVVTRVRSATSLPATCQQGAATQAAELINVNGTLYLCTGPSKWKQFAQAPKPADAVQFVSPNGNDNYDGLSWGSAKQTIMAAYDALPVGPPRNGIVYFTSGVSATSTAGQGIWLCGVHDTACFTSPPVGWRKVTGNVSFIGVGNIPEMLASGTGSNPAIWISGTASSVRFENFQYHSANNGIILGCTVSFDCTGAGGGVSGVTFNHIVGQIGQNPANGPNVRIGSNVFWIFFEDCGFQGNAGAQVGISSVSRTSNVTTVATSSAFKVTVGEHLGLQQVSDSAFDSSFSVASVIDSRHFTVNNTGPNVSTSTLGGTVITDNQIPIVIDPSGGNGSGLIFITSQNNGTVFSMGAVRSWPGAGGAGIYLSGITVEGDFSHIVAPAVWIGGVIAPTNTRVHDIELADTIGATPAVEVDNATPSDSNQTVVSATAGSTPNVGPMVYLDGQLNTASVVSPLRQGQQGFFMGRVEGASNVGRGIFSPVAAQAGNLANTNPSSWTSFNGGSVTTGIAAPDGTTGAGQFSGGSGAPGGLIPVSGGPSIAVGNVYVFGVWVRSRTANGYGNAMAATFATNYLTGGANRCNNSSLATVGIVERMEGDGQWDFVSGVCKMTTADSSIGLGLQVYSDSTHTVQVYAPVVLGFSPDAISDNESYEIANNLSVLPTNCRVGSVCMMPGQELGIGGSTQIMGLMTHSNTANRTYTFPDLTGTTELVIGSGSTALKTGVLGAAACEATITVPANGVTTSTRIQWNFASDPSAIAGYGSVPVNAVHIYAWPTAGNVNFRQCSAVAVRPGAINILWNAYN